MRFALLHSRSDGVIRGYVGEGKFTDDSLETFGGAGVVEIPEMQKLLRYICENGFEHHVTAEPRPGFCRRGAEAARLPEIGKPTTPLKKKRTTPNVTASATRFLPRRAEPARDGADSTAAVSVWSHRRISPGR